MARTNNMRLGINLHVAGSEDKKSVPVQRPMTITMYNNFVSNLRINEQMKDKFRALVTKMPSTALRSVVNNIHEYTRRFEEEIHQELMGMSSFNFSSKQNAIKEDEEEFAIPEINPIKLAEKASQLEKGTETLYGTNTEKVAQETSDEEKIQIKWVNACESDNSSRSTDQCERENHRLHSDLSDGTICHGGLGGELHVGREQSEKGGVVVTGEWDDRLRIDVDSSTGV